MSYRLAFHSIVTVRKRHDEIVRSLGNASVGDGMFPVRVVFGYGSRGIEGVM